MILTTRDDNHSRHNTARHETKVNLQIREPDEPAIPLPALEFPRRLGASHGAGWVLAAYANTQQQSIRCQRREGAGQGPPGAIRTRRERGEDEKDDGGNEEGPFSRIVVGGVAEDEDADDLAGEGEGGDVAAGAVACVGCAVEGFEDCVDRSYSLTSMLVGVYMAFYLRLSVKCILGLTYRERQCTHRVQIPI